LVSAPWCPDDADDACARLEAGQEAVACQVRLIFVTNRPPCLRVDVEPLRAEDLDPGGGSPIAEVGELESQHDRCIEEDVDVLLVAADRDMARAPLLRRDTQVG
jgi:hypothetical protein